MTGPSVLSNHRLLATIDSCIASLCAANTGKTLGIVGFGQIGQEVAKRAYRRFGTEIVVFDPRPISDEALASVNAQRADSLDSLLPLCDIVSLHCSAGPENRHLMTATRLNLMKGDAYLINTSHRDVIDERALAQALWFDTIGGAAFSGFGDTPSIHPDLRDCDTLAILPLVESQTGGTMGGLIATPLAAHIPCNQVA